MSEVYATRDQYNAWARGNQSRGQGTVAHAYDEGIDFLLKTSSRCIDKVCNQWFYPETMTIRRRGRFGGYATELRMPPIISITSVTVNGDVMDSQYYETYGDEIPGWPDYILARTDGVGWPSRAKVDIAGSFGWSEIPEGISMSAMLITNKLAHRPSAPGAVEAGLYIARYDPDVNKLLTDYCRARAA